jgi:hypothetical protein
MRPVTVGIMHPEAAIGAGPLVRWLADARARLAERHRVAFLAAGADDVVILGGRPDELSFGERLRSMVADDRPNGLGPTGSRPSGWIVLGSGAIPLSTPGDLRAFVAAARAEDRQALANNRYSADVVAISRADEVIADVPDLATDNGLPRWLEEARGYAVSDLARRWRLAIDLDSPVDLVITGEESVRESPERVAAVRDRVEAFRAAAGSRRSEILVAGRTSAATLHWLERHTPSRTRAIVEERGLRTAAPGQRPPASVLGAVLDADGPGSVGSHIARLADAAVIDTRVLLAHRLGPDERQWPSAEDRFASDLLCPSVIADPWLRELTAGALEAPIPILLGGHTLVGPGLRLILGRSRTSSRRADGARSADVTREGVAMGAPAP